MANTPIGRVKYKGNDGVSYGVVTFWRGDKGGISVSMDKPSEKYPSINPLVALKRWAEGNGFIDYWPAERRGSAPQPRAQTAPSSGYDGPPVGDPDPFGDDDIPFR